MLSIPVEINRSLLFVKPKQPFVDWLRGLEDSFETTVEQLLVDSIVYLVPEILGPADEAKVLQRCFKAIFEEWLAGWWNDESDWPPRRDLRLFKKWFDVEVHSLVKDLGSEPLHHYLG